MLDDEDFMKGTMNIMALIKCSNCGKEISDTTKKCIHCGATVEKEKQKEKTENKEKNHISKINLNKINLHNDIITKYVINMVFSVFFIFLLCNSKVIITKKSGNYSIMQFINWIFQENATDYMFFMRLIFLIILLNYIFSIFNNKTRKISKIFYILLVIIELLFIFALNIIGYSVNLYYYFIIIYTIVWLIYNFIRKEKLEKNSLIEDSEPNDISQLKKLKELKELLDMEAISETEYQKMKKKILEKEFEKIK